MNKQNATVEQSQAGQAYGWGFWVWLVSSVLFVLLIVFFIGAWSVRHITISKDHPRFSDDQANMILFIADFPVFAKSTIQQLWSEQKEPALAQLIDRETTEKSYWVRHFPKSEDSGYLLFSGMDPAAKQAIVKLIRIADGETVASWIPDWSALNEQITEQKFSPKGSSNSLRAFHPLLLADGDIIFNTYNLLVRQNSCSSKPVWVLDERFHHSNELDETGTGIWVPSVTQDGFPNNSWLREKIRDDALAHISTDGRLLERLSFVSIMRENGMEQMLLSSPGLDGGDPVHLNEIKVATQDTRYWHRGDLLISSAQLNTLFLYRPSTNKIIWHKTGPWMRQHSVDFIDDHRISVFNNNVMSVADIKHQFNTPNDTNQVMVYDFNNEQVTQPFAALLAEAKPLTISEGRARLLPDGGLFLEESNYGRHLRFSKDHLLWSRVNDYDDKRIGLVSWSRYLTAEEAHVPLQALSKRKCAP